MFFIQIYRTVRCHTVAKTHTHTHPFNGPLSRTTQASRYQKGKTNLHFSEARDSAWQWYQLGYMQICTLLQTNNHASTPPLSFLQAGCPSCRPTNSVKALKELMSTVILSQKSLAILIFFILIFCLRLWHTMEWCPHNNNIGHLYSNVFFSYHLINTDHTVTELLWLVGVEFNAPLDTV